MMKETEIVANPDSRTTVKYYSFLEAINMLPLITAYARDFRKTFKAVASWTERNLALANLVSLSPEKQRRIENLRHRIRGKIELAVARLERWKAELKEMHISVCSVQFGRLDVPVLDTDINSVILLCIMPETSEFEPEWHIIGEDHEHARPYWQHVHEH